MIHKQNLKIRSDISVTAVGGTFIGNLLATVDITGNLTGGTFDEVVRSDIGNTSSSLRDATGGVVSEIFDRPSWQSILTAKDSTGRIVNGRAIPDIAGMVGSSNYVINGATGQAYVGSSVTTPLYAGLFAIYRSAFGQMFESLNPIDHYGPCMDAISEVATIHDQMSSEVQSNTQVSF